MASDLGQLAVAFILTGAGAGIVVAAVMSLVKSKLVQPILGRKILHIMTGPIFCIFWLLFPESFPVVSRVLAALVPAAITTYFCLVASRVYKNDVVITTMSRSGSPDEIFRGPLTYGIVHVIGCLLFWTQSPTGVMAIVVLCVGDGVADIVGRRFGRSNPIPWSPRKSFAGSLAFVICACAVMQGVLALFAWRFVPAGKPGSSPSVWDVSTSSQAVVVVAAALVESLPIEHWDNLTVFGAVLGACSLLGLAG